MANSLMDIFSETPFSDCNGTLNFKSRVTKANPVLSGDSRLVQGNTREIGQPANLKQYTANIIKHNTVYRQNIRYILS